MSGEKVPIVVFPRYTTVSSAATIARPYRTPPIDTLAFEKLHVTFWNAAIQGTGAVLSFSFQQSADLEEWLALATTPSTIPTNAGVASTVTATPSQRYVRCIANCAAGSDDARVTLWAVGLGIRTEN